MKRALILAAAALGLAAVAPHACGATGEQNPVINLTGRVNPGFWQNEAITTVNGKREEPHASDDCITAASLRDFLNQKSASRIAVYEYSLKGKHLHITAHSRLYPIKVEEDVYFDDPNHMRALIAVTRGGDDGTVVRTHFSAERIAATCP